MDEFLSNTTPSHSLKDLTDDKARLQEQKNWEYPEKSKQIRNYEGQNMNRLFSESSVPIYEQVSNILYFFLFVGV